MAMRLVLRLDGGADASFSSLAAVSLDQLRKLRAAPGDFVALRSAAASSARVFRLAQGDEQSEAIRVDHWPTLDGERAPGDGELVDVQVLAPTAVRSAQYVELVPASDDQPRLATAFVKSLLRERVLSPLNGTLQLQLDGLNYGAWRYRAFCRGKTSQDDSPGVDAATVHDSTMVLVFPPAAGRLPGSAEVEDDALQPIAPNAQKIKDLVAMTLASGLLQSSLHAPKSLLLQAPSGAGKSTLVRQIAKELGANLLVLDCGLLSTSQLRINNFFAAAHRIQPTLLVIDDLELLFPRVLDETKYKLVCILIRCLEELNISPSARVVVVGTVTDIDSLHAKVRQVFAEETNIGVPDRGWMLKILSSLVPNHLNLSDQFLMSLVTRYGQRPSNMVSIARSIHIKYGDPNSLRIETADKIEAEVSELARIISSASTSSALVGSSVPSVTWNDIGGLEQVKQSIKEMMVWPLEKPHVFHRMGISPPLGMILHGPPGTGKTMLAKAAANASRCNFLNLSASDLMRAEFGESEKAISRAFDTARALSPCLVFIDEFQSLFGNRSTAGATTAQMISQLLVELDGLRAVAEDAYNHDSIESTTSTGRIFVLAATNRLSAIDPALLQPGRFENVIHVGLPSANDREAILKSQRSKMPWHSDVKLDRLVEATNGANAASLVALCRAAAIRAMQRNSATTEGPLEETITMDDFEHALAHGNFEFGPKKQELAGNGEIEGGGSD